MCYYSNGSIFSSSFSAYTFYLYMEYSEFSLSVFGFSLFFWRNKRLNDYADIRYAVYSHILYITFVINTIYHKKSQGNYDHKIFLKTEKRERDSQYLKA